jgi:hypothetical protein
MERGDFSTDSMLLPASSIGSLDGQTPHRESEGRAGRRMQTTVRDDANLDPEKLDEDVHEIDSLA